MTSKQMTHQDVKPIPNHFKYYCYDKEYPDAGYAGVSTIVSGDCTMAVVMTTGTSYDDVVDDSKAMVQRIDTSIPIYITKIGHWFPVNANMSELKEKRHVVSGHKETTPMTPKYAETAILRADGEYLASDEKKMEDAQLKARRQAEYMKSKIKENVMDENSFCVNVTKLDEFKKEIEQTKKKLENLSKRAKLLANMCCMQFSTCEGWYQHYREVYLSHGFSEATIMEEASLLAILEDMKRIDDIVLLDSKVGDVSDFETCQKKYQELTLAQMNESCP